MSDEKESTAVAVAAPAPAPATSSNPPGKAADGGSWGTLKYAGNTTLAMACGFCLCCGPLACCILACPQDEKDAYAVNGKVYDAEGKYVQPKDAKFVPKRETMQR